MGTLNTKRAEDDDRLTLTATSMTTEFDLNDCLSGDEMNSSARTQVYYRKTNARKQQSKICLQKRKYVYFATILLNREKKRQVNLDIRNTGVSW